MTYRTMREEDEVEEPLGKKQKRKVKPLPEELTQLTEKDTALSLKYRDELDPTKGSNTHNMLVKVAYGVEVKDSNMISIFCY